jgi:TonB family protein
LDCIRGCPPPYPSALKGEEGTAVVKITSDSSGNVVDSEIESGGGSGKFNQAVLEAVRKMKFSTPEGESPYVFNMEVNFGRKGSNFARRARERQAQNDRERQAQREQERQAQQERDRLEQERQAQQERDRLEQERQAQQERDRLEQERQAQQERDRLEQERQAQQERDRQAQQDKGPPPTPMQSTQP